MLRWKTFRSLAIWLGFVALIFVALWWADKTFYGPGSQAYEHAGTNHEAPQTSLAVQPQGAAYELHYYSRDEHQETQFLGRSAEAWIAIFTVALVASTIGLWYATFTLGERTDAGIRRLERPYLRVFITNAEDVHAALLSSRTLDPSIEQPPVEIEVHFKVKNYGKTPADNLGGSAKLSAEEMRFRYYSDNSEYGGNSPDLPFSGTTLGAGKTSQKFVCKLISPVPANEARQLGVSSAALAIRVDIRYRDVWQYRYVEHFQAYYSGETFVGSRHETEDGQTPAPLSIREQKWRNFWSRPFSVSDWQRKLRLWKMSARANRHLRQMHRERKRQQRTNNP